jgi:hypothetical protein
METPAPIPGRGEKSDGQEEFSDQDALAAQFEEQAEAQREQMEQATAPAAPIDLWQSSRQDFAVFVVSELAPFVEHLVATFHLPGEVVPQCWWQHQEMLHELTAWYQFHEFMYSKTGSPASPREYMFLLRQHLIPSMREWVKTTGCVAAGKHKTGHVQPWVDVELWPEKNTTPAGDYTAVDENRAEIHGFLEHFGHFASNQLPEIGSDPEQVEEQSA